MPQTEPTSYDADEWGQYRSLSTLAVVAFVLGLCSVATFAGPLLVVVPLAAVATALLALKGIAASEGGLTGARLARWGLALAILFGVASVVQVEVRDRLLQRQADRVSQQWLSLGAQGRAEGMLQLMTQAAIDKIAPAIESGQPAPFFRGILASALMRQDPLVVRLQELPEADRGGFQLRDTSVSSASKPPQAVFRYVIGGSDVVSGPATEQQSCLLVLKRFRSADFEVIWLVDSWQLE